MKPTLAFALLLAASLGGCDHDYIAFTLDGGDAGGRDGGPDVSPPVATATVVEQCGDPLVKPINETTTRIDIDTRGATRHSTALCGEPAGAQQVFMAIDAQAGDVWHVHLSALDTGGDPRMAMLSPACDTRDCEAQARFCDGAGDEHFTFEAQNGGRYWIAVDDTLVGGGRYRAEAYRLLCGDGTQTHGEACDDGNSADGDGCDRRCRVELSTLRTSEVEPNDHRLEANVLRLEEGALTIRGTLAGPGACAYPDVFTLAHPGGTLTISTEADGACDTAGQPMQARVMNAIGALLETFELTDCAGGGSIADLVAGEYSIEISAGVREVPLAYRLSVETSD